MGDELPGSVLALLYEAESTARTVGDTPLADDFLDAIRRREAGAPERLRERELCVALDALIARTEGS